MSQNGKGCAQRHRADSLSIYREVRNWNRVIKPRADPNKGRRFKWRIVWDPQNNTQTLQKVDHD